MQMILSGDRLIITHLLSFGRYISQGTQVKFNTPPIYFNRSLSHTVHFVAFPMFQSEPMKLNTPARFADTLEIHHLIDDVTSDVTRKP